MSTWWEEPDWTREAKSFWSWQPDRSLLASIRAYQKYRQLGPWARPLRMIATLRYRFWSIVTGAEVPLMLRAGGGLMLPHPNGIVIHPNVELGPNCLLLQQVTLGHGTRQGLPKIGAHVDIGAGAKVLGGVTIGDGARIGANAVVLIDVPPGRTAVGVPAVLTNE